MRFSKKILAVVIIAAILIILIGILAVQVKKGTRINEADLIQPKAVTIDHSLDQKQVTAMIHAAQLYYTFCNTGQNKYLDAAIAPTFVDNTSANGRPQGPAAIMSKLYLLRQAIPDLKCSIEELLISGNKVTARLVFTGTSKGEFMNHAPTHKSVQFTGIDILEVKDGKLVTGWHSENELELLQQLHIL